MNSRERVIAALYHEEPDLVPFFDWLYNDVSIRRILGKEKDYAITPDVYIKGQQALDFGLVAVFFDAPESYKP